MWMIGCCQERTCYRVSTQIWSRVEHALNRQDALNNEVCLIIQFCGTGSAQMWSWAIVCIIRVLSSFQMQSFMSSTVFAVPPSWLGPCQTPRACRMRSIYSQPSSAYVWGQDISSSLLSQGHGLDGRATTLRRLTALRLTSVARSQTLQDPWWWPPNVAFFCQVSCEFDHNRYM